MTGPDLAARIAALVPREGTYEQGSWGVFCTRRSHPGIGPQRGLYRSSVCLVGQGAKRVLLGKEAYDYDEETLIVSAVDVPVVTEVVRASPASPYLGVRINLDPMRLALLVPRVFPRGVPPRASGPSLATAPVDSALKDAVGRLLDALADREHAELLVPVAQEEVLLRLLLGPVGPRLAQLSNPDSGLFGVFRVVAWLRDHFAEPARIEDLARLANMSVSSFHRHFRAVTAVSPLQYQKTLRLQEARALLWAQALDVGQAALRVGYVSPSQFSREYSRYFGHNPTKDLAPGRSSPE